MKNKFDYSFLNRSIDTVRIFKGCYPYSLERGALEAGNKEQLERSPKILVPPDKGEGNCLFEAASYAVKSGHGLAAVQKMIGNPLPDDILDFYAQYEKSLVVTRTYPLHLWNEAKIIEGIKWHREFYDKPFRLLRFGDQYDRQCIYFALWLELPGTQNWRVISTDHGSIDDMDEEFVDQGQIIGQSFYEWLQSWVERDGLPDPFMDLGREGGFMDPPTDADMARIESRGLTG